MPAIPHRIRDLKSCNFYVSPLLLLPLNLSSLDFRLYSGLHTDTSPSDRCSLSFLPSYSRLPLRPVLTNTTSKFSHKLSSIRANRRHKHTQTDTHKYHYLIQISLSKKEQKQIHDSSCCCLQLPNSKQTNKQTNISLDYSNPVKEENTEISLAIPQILSSFFRTTRVPTPTKLTPKAQNLCCYYLN
jgi:hypothetical protein